MREHRDERGAQRRHGQYVWRDPESHEQLRVDVFGSEEFFEDLEALGFVPGEGMSADPAHVDHQENGLDRADTAVETPIRQLHAGGIGMHPRGSSEGRVEVRRRGA